MRFLLFLTGLLLTIPAFSQKLYKDYSFYPQEEGTLYFIFPQKGFRSENKTVKKDLEYDITYFTKNDSVSFTYSYTNQAVRPTDSLSFIGHDGKLLYTGKGKMLFVQPQKKYWKHRALIKIPIPVFTSIYAMEAPAKISIHSSGQHIEYEMKPSKWKTQTWLIARIFEMIKYNKQ